MTYIKFKLDDCIRFYDSIRFYTIVYDFPLIAFKYEFFFLLFQVLRWVLIDGNDFYQVRLMYTIKLVHRTLM